MFKSVNSFVWTAKLAWSAHMFHVAMSQITRIIAPQLCHWTYIWYVVKKVNLKYRLRALLSHGNQLTGVENHKHLKLTVHGVQIITGSISSMSDVLNKNLCLTWIENPLTLFIYVYTIDPIQEDVRPMYGITEEVKIANSDKKATT